MTPAAETPTRERSDVSAVDTPRDDGADRPKRYHEMAPDERRASWAVVREANRREARRTRQAPLWLITASVAALLAGVWVYRHGLRTLGAILLFASLPLAAFAVIAFAKHLVHGLPGSEGDLPPPPPGM